MCVLIAASVVTETRSRIIFCNVAGRRRFASGLHPIVKMPLAKKESDLEVKILGHLLTIGLQTNG